MYKNLKAEIARAGLNKEDLAQLLNISAKDLIDKLSGKSAFMLDECLKIKSALAGNRLGLEYLFKASEGNRLVNKKG
jgi:hypothetical protein